MVNNLHRRSFIQSGAAGLASVILPAHVARAQGLKRAAVVIGVRKVGTHKELNSTVPGARLMAQFLEDQGYSVWLHVDDPENGVTVEVGDILRNVTGIVDGTKWDQLLIYFSGHGIRMPHRGEMWLLSHAQDFSNEAINLVTSAEICQYCKIPNIVFISDACRSKPDSMNLDNVLGTCIFPTRDGKGDIKIDKFFAALPGNPSFEVSVETSVKNYRSIYTDAFLAAYIDPPDTRTIHLDGLEIVPNRKLEKFLPAETRRLADIYDVVKNVEPASEIPSADEVYIGRAWHHSDMGDNLPDWVKHVDAIGDTGGRDNPATLADGYNHALIEKGVALDFKALTELQDNLDGLSTQIDGIYSRLRQDWLTPEKDLSLNGAPAGIASYGQPFAEVVTSPPMEQQRLDGDAAERVMSHAALFPETLGSSALAIFPDGVSVVVPIFNNYVTHVFKGETDVEGVSFELVPEKQFLGDAQRRDLAELRALVTQATADGTFVFAGQMSERDELAAEFADRIREYKAVDPTLGILSAYAYSYARLSDQVASVRRFMLRDLDTPVFDVDLLNRRSRGDYEALERLEEAVPFCPVMRAGWELLEIKGVGLPRPIEAARQYLRSSLWSSFDPEGTEILAAAIQEGSL